MLINPNDYAQLLQIAITLLIFLNVLAFIAKKKSVHLTINVILLIALSSLLYLMFASSVVQQSSYFNINQFSELLALLLTSAMILVNLLAYNDDSYNAFGMFSAFALVGMYAVAFAGNLVMILVGVEFMMIPTVFAILVSKAKSLEAAVKLFVLAALSIAILTFGIALFYGGTNTISFVQAPLSKIVEIGLIFLLAGLGFEASLFPFNLWVPDTYELSPTYVTAMLGGINKKVGFIALIEITLLAFSQYESQSSLILAVIAILTMFYGNITALAQSNVKRMMAYSAISQSGYILIGIVFGTQYGISASIFQIFAHSFMFIGAMAVILYMENKNRNNINEYTGLYTDNKLAAVALTVFFISMIGVPFTAGFIGKFLLFSSAVYAGVVALALIGIVNSIISVYYYLKVIMAMFANKENKSYTKMSKSIAAVIIICLAFTLVVGIFPNALISATNAAAAALLGT